MGSCVLIIGAGGVGRVVTHRCAQATNVFDRVVLASRTLAKCEAIASEISRTIDTRTLNADTLSDTLAMIRKAEADLVINVASPYQNLTIMEACRQSGVHYIDTSADDDQKTPKFDYADQWAFDDGFRLAGITGILSIGFDPGVVNVFCSYAQKHLFDTLEEVDIIDCNAGDHGKAFATNFDPETNIREIIAPGKYWENGEWQFTEPLTLERTFHFPGIGERSAKLIYHEELESLVKYIPSLKRAQFWMTFSKSYLEYLQVLLNVGLTSSEPIDFYGQSVVPLQFLKQLLPDPGTLGSTTKGQTCIGCLMKGTKDGQQKSLLIYNNCDHETCYQECKSQAVSYTTGVPAVLAAQLVLSGKWREPGVFCPEQMDPDPMMDALNQSGLPWKIIELT